MRAEGKTPDWQDPWGIRVPRLLVIDDNPSIHRDFDLVLRDDLANRDLEAQEDQIYQSRTNARVEKPAYEIDHAFSGIEGVEKVVQARKAEKPYQVAFVDIRMPGIDGVETIERLWKQDARVQVVICTAFADYSWDELAQRLGPADNLLVLKKPFDSIEVTQMASTLSRKWFLGRQASMKMEQMELLVAKRTEQLLAFKVPQEKAAASDPGEQDQPTILLVGNRAVRDLAAALAGGDYQLRSAASLQEAVRLGRDFIPDLILADSADPDINLTSLRRELGNEDLMRHIPFIALGADCRDATGNKTLSAAIVRQKVEDFFTSTNAPDSKPAERQGLSETLVTSTDGEFLRKAVETIERQLADYEFDVDALAKLTAMSRRQLFRRLKAAAGTTPNHLIRTLRLKRAAELLENSRLTVTEVTYAVGFSDLKHFREVFRNQYGVLPTDYKASLAPHQ